MPRPIVHAWRSFLEKRVSPNASKTQADDLKISFFAGAACVYLTLMEGLSEDDVPTEGDMELMEDIHRDLASVLTGFPSLEELGAKDAKQ